MFAAVLTTLLFSISAICGRSVSHYFSSTVANLARLGIAATFLGVWSHLSGGAGTHAAALPFLFLSGCS